MGAALLFTTLPTFIALILELQYLNLQVAWTRPLDQQCKLRGVVWLAQ